MALFNIASYLKRIADQFRIAVVIINQVGGLINNSGVDGSLMSTADGTDVVAVSAALGTSWHHCVSTRILLQYERDPHRLGSALDVANEEAVKNMAKIRKRDDNDNDGDHHQRHAWMSERGHIRTATVVKSNVAGVSSMSYKVTTMGVCEVE
eukprot:4567082-Ditylum_brightwellii.AAC.1